MKAQVVSFRCVLSDKLGKIISTTFNRDVLTYRGKDDDLLMALAEELQNLKEGERRCVALPAHKAYGLYDPKLLVEISREEFLGGTSVSKGQEVELRDHEGVSRVYRVVLVSGDRITLDGNHPLAGQDLVFDIETLEARDATSEELAEIDPQPQARRYH